MHANKSSLVASKHTYVRIYECPACHHEMRLTVWGTDDLTHPCFQDTVSFDFFRTHTRSSAQDADALTRPDPARSAFSQHDCTALFGTRSTGLQGDLADRIR
jgi:hypothetical protein